MSFDAPPETPVAGALGTLGQAAVTASASLQAEIQNVVSGARVADSIASFMQDPLDWAKTNLRGSGTQVVNDALKAGISLIVDNAFCDQAPRDQSCQTAAQIAADVIVTTPGAGGLRDRVDALSGGLKRFYQDKMDELSAELSNFNLQPGR